MNTNLTRCEWCGDDPLYVKYHDEEWGVPLHDENKLFEFLVLEGAQAGLSWITVLKKRENYRKAFDNFDPQIVSKYDEKKFFELMNNEGIIRNKLKIKSAIYNATKFIRIQKRFGTFDNYIWSFVDHKPIVNKFETIRDIPAKTKIAEAMSKDLQERGFRFVGPTICYAHMQATGMVNDHVVGCFRYNEINSQSVSADSK